MVDYIDPGPIEFEATVRAFSSHPSVKYVELPFEPLEAYGARRDTPVRVRADGHEFVARLSQHWRDGTDELINVLGLRSGRSGNSPWHNDDVIQVRLELDAPKVERHPRARLELNELKEGLAGFDGALADIVIENTDESDWETLIESLIEGDERFPHLVGGAANVPLTRPLFRGPDEDIRTLTLVLAPKLTANAHFYDELEIEFDVDPREIVDQGSLDVIASFMRRIGDHLGKRVGFYQESFRDAEDFAYWPSTRAFTVTEFTPQS